MNNALKTALAKELKAIRKDKGLSQEELAERVNILRASVANYETARRDIPLDTFFKVCDACGVDPYDVLDRVRKYVYKK